MAIEGITSASLYAHQLLRRPQGTGKGLGPQTPAINPTTLPQRAKLAPPPESWDTTPGFGMDGGEKLEIPKTGIKGGTIAPPSHDGGGKDVGMDGGEQLEIPKTGIKGGTIAPPSHDGGGKDVGMDRGKKLEVPRTGIKGGTIAPPSHDGSEKKLGSEDPSGLDVAKTGIKSGKSSPPSGDSVEGLGSLESGSPLVPSRVRAPWTPPPTNYTNTPAFGHDDSHNTYARRTQGPGLDPLPFVHGDTDPTALGSRVDWIG